MKIKHKDIHTQAHHSQKTEREKYWKQQEKRLYLLKQTPIKLTADFLSETVESRRKWNSIFNVLDKIFQSRTLYPAKYLSNMKIK